MQIKSPLLIAFLFFAAIVVIGFYLSYLSRPYHPSTAVGNGVAAGTSHSPSAGDVTPTQSGYVPDAGSDPWTYSETRDEMRGTITRIASVTSDNTLEFSFPYNGGSTGTLTLRRDPRRGLNVMLQVSKGQFVCSSYEDDAVAVKFDDRPILHYKCSQASDGRADVLFLSPEQSFLRNLLKSQSVVIEAEFYQEGNRQLMFRTAGLKRELARVDHP